jgi:hypothetical protein
MTDTARFTVDALANEIRRLGGTSVLGCGALAEALMPFLATPSTGAVGEPVAWEYEFFGGNDIAPRWTRCVGLDDPRHTWGDTMVRSVRPLYASRSDTVGPEAGE